MKFPSVSALSLLVAAAIAVEFLHLEKPVPPVDKEDSFPITSATATNTSENDLLSQLLDHDSPSKGASFPAVVLVEC
jgi:hypothetical protein